MRWKWVSRLKELERRVALKWIGFSTRHSRSPVLPVALFALLFVDGFVMVIPSNLCLIAAVTISPARWILFSTLASVAVAGNNAATYLLGRLVPDSMVLMAVEFIGVAESWERAQQAISDYGPFAAFVGVFASLPTQIMTAIIGIADAEASRAGASISSTFLEMIGLVFVACFLRFLVVAGLTRFGWIKLERRLESHQGR